MNPYYLTSLLFAFLAVLGAAEAAGVSFSFLPGIPGLRWMRVHLITLGVVTEILFGLLPAVVAQRRGSAPPKVRLDIWLLLTMGILTLLFGVPLTSMVIITAGAALVFTAGVMLYAHLRGLGGEPVEDPPAGPGGRPFYLAGLAYLLLGVFIGSGIWFGWLGRLGMKIPVEVHIHANSWGFMSLVFAGLLIDFYPKFSGRPLAWPGSTGRIFWLMNLGALGLVLGPWTGWLGFTAPGLVLHVAATIWLLLNIIVPWRGTADLKTPGPWHLMTSYIWILAPIAVAPLVIFQVAGFPGAGIEQNAPQALVYGWMLQFMLPLLPYFFAGGGEARLGGSWWSLALVHAGGILLWASIFIDPLRGLLHGGAYTAWGLALLPMLRDIWLRVQPAADSETDVAQHAERRAAAR